MLLKKKKKNLMSVYVIGIVVRRSVDFSSFVLVLFWCDWFRLSEFSRSLSEAIESLSGFEK